MAETSSTAAAATAAVTVAAAEPEHVTVNVVTSAPAVEKKTPEVGSKPAASDAKPVAANPEPTKTPTKTDAPHHPSPTSVVCIGGGTGGPGARPPNFQLTGALLL